MSSVTRWPPEGHDIVPLGPDTWDTFAELVERNSGVYGGCWCIGHHPECGQRTDHRATKHARVMDDAAHAALVLDSEGRCQAWAQYGSPDEPAGITHKRAYDKDPPPPPDWRLTCVFVDADARSCPHALVRPRSACEALLGAPGLTR